MALKRLTSIAWCAVALAQSSPKGVISGTVIDGETGDPLRKAIVTLTLQGTPRRWATARTDGSGRFQFDALPPGKYDLRANKGQEGTAIYGANDVRGLGDIITLGDGETVAGLKLRFLRAASVSGHIYDSDGEPVPGVDVHLLRQSRNLGLPILTNNRIGSTDDRGEYHILNVDPGQYYLRTTTLNVGRRFGPGSGQPLLVDQYYGGALEAKDASAVHVRGGESLAGIDFRLNSEPPVQVRGRVSGVPEEALPPPPQPAAGPVFFSGPMQGGPSVEVTVSPVETGGTMWSSGTAAQVPEFRYQLPDMAAGHYRIEAVFHSGSKTYGAYQVLDLHAGSGEVILSLTPAKDITGTLRWEGPPASRPSALHVQLGRTTGGRGTNISAEVGPEGRFVLPQVPVGEWALSVNPLPPGFLKSAQLGDKDVRFTTFDGGVIDKPSLNIVVSMNTATVEGEVDSPDSKRASIIIAPVTGPYHDLARFYYGAAADDQGKFKLLGIAPGKYRIFAIEKMAAASFRNPEAVDQLYELGADIELTEGATTQVKPKLIPLERAMKAIQ